MNRCAAHVAVKEVKGEMVETCKGTTFDGKRGLCSECYSWLIENGLIKDGDKFGDYPDWLQELIRDTDKEDHRDVRHPVEEYDTNDEVPYRPTRTKIPLVDGDGATVGCYKARKLAGFGGFVQN